MTLGDALKWADTYTANINWPQGGSTHALIVLAAEVRRLQEEIKTLKQPFVTHIQD